MTGNKEDKHPELVSADDFLSVAAHNSNAEIRQVNSGFKKVVVPHVGSVHIKPGRERLDPQTKRNLVKWFKLLGLLIFLAGCGILFLIATGHLFIVL